MKRTIAIILTFLLLCGAASAESAAECAQQYLEYIGTQLTNRNITAVGAEPEEGNAHGQTVEWIISELKAAGYSDDQICADTMDQVSPDDGKTYPVQNIVLTVEGTDPARQIIVGAHYDGEGISDNGSGVALLLSACVSLAESRPLYTVRYVFFDAEEVDLVGSALYVQSMTDEEIEATEYMINIDSIAFGDYCNIYSGVQDDETLAVTDTQAYELAVEKAKALGINVMTTAELNGYFAENGEGPAIDANTLYTNPWTFENPAPVGEIIVSPSTGDWSDHTDFKYSGIPYLYFEATNWFAAGDEGEDAYSGYFETADTSIGYYGMFMNTEFDTLENLNSWFPGRSLAHFNLYCPLLNSLILNPAGAAPVAE